MTPQAFTGARAILSVNGEPIAWATNVSYQIESRHEELITIDDALPAELAPTRLRVQGTMRLIRVAGKNSPSLLGIQPTSQDFLTHPYVTIELRDRKTDDTILFIPKAKIQRRAGQIEARNVGEETLEFIGIGFWDEKV